MASVLVYVKEYKKLVRDRIPEILERLGKRVVWRELNDGEFLLALKAKVLEEARELVNASDDDALLSELADLTEVIGSIIRAYNLSARELERARREKREQRGSFTRRIFLESASD